MILDLTVPTVQRMSKVQMNMDESTRQLEANDERMKAVSEQSLLAAQNQSTVEVLI